MSEARDWPAPGFEVGALASFIPKPIEKKTHGAEEYILLGGLPVKLLLQCGCLVLAASSAYVLLSK